MKFTIAIAALLSVSSAALLQRAPQNDNRPVPEGECCVANTSLKQDLCIASNGEEGRCVPGGNACGGSLSCVEFSNLECDNAVIERGSSLCRAITDGGLFDGANVIQDLSQATVN